MSNLKELKNTVENPLLLLKEIKNSGVEFKKLGEVAEIRAGFGFPLKEQGKKTGDFPFYKVADMNHIENSIYMNVSENYITFEIAKKLKCNPAPKDTIIFPKVGMTIKTNKKRLLSKVSCYDNNIFGLIADDKYILPKFLYYLFDQVDLIKFAFGETAVPSIRKSAIENFEIPIPPLEVQAEIVRILDSFTKDVNELIDLLKREQELRKKQYSYYRDKLLTFDGDTPNVKLGEIGKIFRGSGITKDQIKNVGTPCVRYGEIYTKYGIYFDKCYSYIDENDVPNKKYFSYGDILFAVTGENVIDIGKCTAYIGDEQCIAGGDMIVLTNHNQEPKYLSYALSTTNAIKQKTKNKRKNTRVHLSLDEIGKIVIPLPPIDTQKRIVDILDNLERYTNDLQEGLPAEIEKRKKQYAYYRDELLKFERK